MSGPHEHDGTSAAGATALRVSRLFELASRLQQCAEREKDQLARRLHDELGGLLTAAKMDLYWLQARIEDSTLRERLAQLGGALDDAMALKREVVNELRPSLLDHFGLATALRDHVESVCGAAGLHCKIELAENLNAPPRDTAIALFRVIEEGLRNVVRHAQANEVRLSFESGAQCWRLRLTDDGRGMDIAAQASTGQASFGLAGMRHRVEALGGTFGLDSAPGRGTRLSVELPISSGPR